MKYFLASFSLCAAIALIAIGIQINNPIIICIGGAFAGVYNAIIYKQN